MKVVIEIAVIILLILLGWRQSFSEHVRRIVSPEQATRWALPSTRTKPSPRQVTPDDAASTPRDASWMWRRKILDPPAAEPE
jgi:hypothetical protein